MELIPTYFAGNRPTEVPWLNVSLGDFMGLVLVFVGCTGVLGFFLVALAGFKGWVMGVAVGLVVSGALWGFVRDNWGTVVPKEREVLSSVVEAALAPRELAFEEEE